MSLVLGIDTSTDVRVGLALDGVVLASAAVTDTRAHAEQLIPLVVGTLSDAGRRLDQIELIVVGVGPGPFTGLRVGVVTAQTLGLVLGVDVRGVCGLDVVAVGHRADGEFLVVVDARRREVYWARYAADGRRLEGPHVSPPADLPDLAVTGPGAALAGGTPVPLDGGLLAAAGPELPEAGLSPLYLRRPDAEVPSTRKSTLLQPRLAPGWAGR